ncbi:MAG: MBL fold metallo-hydrolase [Burkholderiales bacterium]|nr:MBL fold metallo-hydrolase [Burkholderiales bacterium]
MKVRFWGTRGSLPVALTAKDVRQKVIDALKQSNGKTFASDDDIVSFVDNELPFETKACFGGNTSCVTVDVGFDTPFICDLGSGARPLGNAMVKRFGPKNPQTYHVFMSHLHWDHIMGFPFFVPVYIPGNKIIIHSGHSEVEFAFRRQQGEPSFPVTFEQLAANIEFQVHEPGVPFEVEGTKVLSIRQKHGGDSYGWRFEKDGKSMVYSTDSEHKIDDREGQEAFVEFFRSADLVVFDAMYSLLDSISVKADWGHSSNIFGVALCQRAEAKTLALFHHEPIFSDAHIQSVLLETQTFEEATRGMHELNVITAYDGLELDL